MGVAADMATPIFFWLARQERIRKGKSVKLGMDKAQAKGKPIGRPVVVNIVEANLAVQLRQEGKSQSQIAKAHPRVKSSSGKQTKLSVGSIRRVFERQVAR